MNTVSYHTSITITYGAPVRPPPSPRLYQLVILRGWLGDCCVTTYENNLLVKTVNLNVFEQNFGSRG